MFETDRVEQIATDVDAWVRALDVEVVAAADAQAMVGVLAKVGRQVDAAIALLGSRVADAARSEEEAARWLAGQTRSDEREATDRLQAGGSSRRHEATRTRFQEGDLSTRTAGAIGGAADADPDSEQRLLDHVDDTSAEDTRKKAHRARRRAQQAKETEQEREQRRHAARRLSSWEDDDGGIAGRFSATCRQWAPIGKTLDVFREAAFRRARRVEQKATSGAAYAMDGLELMAHVATGGVPADLGYVDADLPAALRKRLAGAHTGGSGAATGGGCWKAIVRVDAAALRRGWAEGDEVCDIAGVGPVSVAAVRDLLPQAFVGVVITDGHDVVSVAHVGRRPDAVQTTALQWRHPTCTTMGCRHTARIQADHDDDWAATHDTWLPGLNGACDTCHAKKTNDGWAWIGDADADGKRTFVPPTDPRHPRHTGEGRGRPPEVRPKPGQMRDGDAPVDDTRPTAGAHPPTSDGHPPRGPTSRAGRHRAAEADQTALPLAV